jgi:hypothetical protein
MLALIKSAAHVLAIRMSGKIIAADIERYKSSFEAMPKYHHRISVYCDISGLSDMSADALLTGAKADFEFLSQVERFERFAFVTDKEWPAALI